MNNILSGIGIIVVGFFTIVWYIIKIIACVMIAGLISTKLGLDGNYWWYGSIVSFCILMKLVFLNTNPSSYGELVDKYKNKTEE